MIYEVKFTKSARKEINKLSPQIALRITKAIYKLAANPKIGRVRPMVGSRNWRLRGEDYRVIYTIQKKKITIVVIKVGHRSKVYKNL